MGTSENWKPPDRRRIYLLRHGEVSYFDAQGRPYRPNSVPLNEEGRGQAEAAAVALADVLLDRVLTSDLERCVETAKVVSGARNLPLVLCPELREVQPGRLADIPAGSIESAFVGAFAGTIDRQTQFLNGETFGSLSDRVLACYRKVLADPGWRHLLIVAHGGVNRVLLGQALGSGWSCFAALEQDPGCINILDVDPEGRHVLRLVNYTPYSAVKVGMAMTTMEKLYCQFRRAAGGPV
jgi:probable phosphoglycerate mutase